MTMHPDDSKRVQPAALRETAAELLAVFGEDDGARLIVLCADRIEQIEEDRDYWRSRTLALEADRRALLLEHGIDLGERPSLEPTPEPR